MAGRRSSVFAFKSFLGVDLSSATEMSFSWVPTATHTHNPSSQRPSPTPTTHRHACSLLAAPLLGKCSLFPSIHNHALFRQAAFLLPEVSSFSLWPVTENLHILNDPFHWASSLLSKLKGKQQRNGPPQDLSAHTRSMHVVIHTSPLSITTDIPYGLRI